MCTAGGLVDAQKKCNFLEYIAGLERASTRTLSLAQVNRKLSDAVTANSVRPPVVVEFNGRAGRLGHYAAFPQFGSRWREMPFQIEELRTERQEQRGRRGVVAQQDSNQGGSWQVRVSQGTRRSGRPQLK